jgi:hypothetical protein
MNRTFKVIGRYKAREEQPSWMFGRPHRIAMRRVYVSLEDFEKYGPKLIKSYKKHHDVEAYELIDGKWVEIKSCKGLKI